MEFHVSKNVKAPWSLYWISGEILHGITTNTTVLHGVFMFFPTWNSMDNQKIFYWNSMEWFPRIRSAHIMHVNKHTLKDFKFYMSSRNLAWKSRTRNSFSLYTFAKHKNSTEQMHNLICSDKNRFYTDNDVTLWKSVNLFVPILHSCILFRKFESTWLLTFSCLKMYHSHITRKSVWHTCWLTEAGQKNRGVHMTIRRRTGDKQLLLTTDRLAPFY